MRGATSLRRDRGSTSISAKTASRARCRPASPTSAHTSARSTTTKFSTTAISSCASHRSNRSIEMKLHQAVILAALALSLARVAGAQDVVKVSPSTNKVLIDNQYVRVIEATFKPGAREAMHTHPAGWYYVTRAGKLKVSYASGKVETW